ncbi:hypothetical protein KR50_08570 [Jeotgalibacillus campisalis]|uniref:Beta-carotene 15,15'-monooxygenase n=2 Tax=Jeotgalibacillus campisalis TaxID=220754 RepID=A0A0C2W2Y9_9BACL|nr:hypothetical protein KR50_08570 [Jeotgalibacillus campisalis]
MVIGSMLDLIIVAPLLAYAAFPISKKQAAGLTVLGLLAARFIIPMEYFAPYTMFLYIALIAEGVLILIEIALIVWLIRKVPSIKAEMNRMDAGPIFALLPAVQKMTKDRLFIRVILSEGMMLYYALFSWRKNPPRHEGAVTLHKNTSAIAFHIMIIHAIVIETIGIHWWLHDRWPVLSIILLCLNMYSILLFLAEIQITRLHPVEVKNGNVYAAQGLMKRIVFQLKNIEKVEWNTQPGAHAMTFMLKDFEEVHAQAVVSLKKPVEGSLFMGKKQMVTVVAFRVDEPEKFKRLLEGNRTDVC